MPQEISQAVRKYLDKFEAEKNAKQNVVVPQRQEKEKRGALSGLETWMSKNNWDEAMRERAKGVSYKTLYKELAPKEVSYWNFWKTLKAKAALPPPTTVFLVHKPGERTQVDDSDGNDVVCHTTGVVSTTQLFTGVLPFSQKVFAEFTASQKPPSSIESHERMWNYFGGVTDVAPI